MNITLETSNDKIIVTTPYHYAFPDAAKAAGGIWNKAASAWEFPLAAETAVRAALLDTFKTDARGTEPLTRVRVTMNRNLTNRMWDDVWLAGKLIAATARKNGNTRPGEDVTFESGEPSCYGGSKQSLVPAGSVFLLADVTPEGLAHLERVQTKGTISFEIVD